MSTRFFLLPFLVLVFITATKLWAADAKSVPKDDAKGAAKVSRLFAMVEFGDKVSRFELTADGKDFKLDFESSYGDTASRKVTAAGFNGFADAFKKLPQVSRLPASCDRSRVSVTLEQDGKAKTKSSCFGVSTVTEPAYVKFMNRLAMKI